LLTFCADKEELDSKFQVGSVVLAGKFKINLQGRD